MQDPRSAVAPIVAAFAVLLEGRAAGLYVGGSMAGGDYRPGVSDIDAVVLLDRPLTRRDRADQVALHGRLAALHESAQVLHCVYVARSEVVALEHKHWTWAFGEMFRRPLGGIARAELLADPIVLFGPPPSVWLQPMDAVAIGAAARAELSGYWARAVRRRTLWLDDVYVDLGLTVWARADAAIRDGVLITKSEAIERLRVQGLPAAVVDGVAARREGEATEISMKDRDTRAVLVREFLTRELKRLTHP